MTSESYRTFVATAILLLNALPSMGEPATRPGRTEDVIYGRKFGMALTMDVFKPDRPNGAAVVYVVSGGWFSAKEMTNIKLVQPFLARGYTCFAVVHGSQPRYTINECIEDMHRSIRFIRGNAARFGINPDRIGITGGSAGGHLSLMIATSGKPGAADAKDPIDRLSSRVQAVGCFFPPTDFLNYGEDGRNVFVSLENELKDFKAPFDFREFDREKKHYVPVTDETKRLEIIREISPVTHVTAETPPTLIIHGDADKLVPIQQAYQMLKKLEQFHVPVKLDLRPGAGHGWPNWDKDLEVIADWFDAHLKTPAATRPAASNADK